MRAFSAWPRAPDVATCLCATTWRKALSVATARSALSAPSTSCRRDQSEIAVGVGSPDITPSEKRPARASGTERADASEVGTRTAAAAAEPARVTNCLRVCTAASLTAPEGHRQRLGLLGLPGRLADRIGGPRGRLGLSGRQRRGLRRGRDGLLGL